MQVLYPDEFNYAVAACPDPIGFSSFTTINLYQDKNAYHCKRPSIGPLPRRSAIAANMPSSFASSAQTTRRSSAPRGPAIATTILAPLSCLAHPSQPMVRRTDRPRRR